MTKTVADKLSELVEAVRALPDETQQALVQEFADRLSDFTDSSLSQDQRTEIDRRLANPRYADPDKVRDFFARHGIERELRERAPRAPTDSPPRRAEGAPPARCGEGN
jgi:hypothetical protein